jgi:hypothetical protein
MRGTCLPGHWLKSYATAVAVASLAWLAGPRLGNNPAFPRTAGAETALAESGNSQARGRHDRDGQNPPPRVFAAIRHEDSAQRAVTIVVHALSSLGSSRLLAICTFSLRHSPRTTGQ